MKKTLFTLIMLITTTSIFAANDAIGEPFTFDLASFTGLIGLVSFLVTQVAKFIPAVKSKNWVKILTSVVVGIATSILAWLTDLASFMQGLEVWKVIVYGVGAGLSGCGFYDLIKPFIDRFCKAPDKAEKK